MTDDQVAVCPRMAEADGAFAGTAVELAPGPPRRRSIASKAELMRGGALPGN